jgi:hypothetical protein
LPLPKPLPLLPPKLLPSLLNKPLQLPLRKLPLLLQALALLALWSLVTPLQTLDPLQQTQFKMLLCRQINLFFSRAKDYHKLRLFL